MLFYLDESRRDGESQPGGLGVLDDDDVVGVSAQALDFLLPAQVPNFDRPATYRRVNLILSFVCCNVFVRLGLLIGPNSKITIPFTFIDGGH